MATTTQATVVAVFKNNSDAQAAAEDLKSNGFDTEDIYISSEGARAPGAAAETGYSENRPVTHQEGGIKGWFKSIFGSEEDEDRYRYENAVTGGKILLSVETTEEDIDEVADILNRHSPVDVHETAVSTGQPPTTGSYTETRSGDRQANRAESFPVVEEELRVGKRSVLRGGVRVYSRIVEQPVEESVRLREEKVRVERQPVNRPASEADLRAGQQEVTEVKEYAEEPVVSKQARVVEEVRVGKDATERTETVRDTVRRTEVEVEDLERKGPQSADVDDEDLRTKSATTNR